MWDEYGRTLAAQCRNVLHADTDVYVTGIPVMLRDVENWRSLQYYHNAQTLKNMQRAEREGYDAFVIGCTLDVGLAEGKSMLDIPVVGISEAAYRMAMTMGRLFAVVTSSPAFSEVYGEQVEPYGVANRYLRGPYIVPASEEEIATALTKPQALSVAVKTAEMLVDLRKAGVAPSRRIGVYCKPNKEFEKQAYARMEKVFSIR